MVKGKLKNIFRRLFYRDYWVIGITRNEVVSNIKGTITVSDHQITWLNSFKDFFLADPYWLDEDKRIIICECLFYKDKKGKLAVVYLNEDWSFKEMRLVNSKSAHYSYPHVLRIDNTCYVVPESAFDNYLKLLEIDEVTHDVVSETVLIDNCRLVDPTIFFHEGKYWLFANPLEDFNNSLCVYYSQNIKGPWIKTGYSPLSIKNCRGAGGIFMKNGQMFWPTQFNEKVYGGGIVIRKIVELDTEQFVHETQGFLKPDENSRYPIGLHTLNIGKNLTLIDGKGYSFQPLKPFSSMYSRLKNFNTR
ncbi:MAG TPA: hypothetical protein VGC29_02055 [Flavisolibacter sp.]